MFSKDGVSPDPRKVEATRSAGPPRNATDFNSFLCTVRYSARFMEAKRFQKASSKLGELLKGKLIWEKEHQEALNELKGMLKSGTYPRRSPKNRSKEPQRRI